MNLSDLNLNRYLYKEIQDMQTKGAEYVGGNNTTEEPTPVASGGAAQDINTGNVYIDGNQIEPGTIPQQILDVSNWGWGQTCAFSSTDSDTVSWGAGTFTSADGNAYSISAGNTGNMVAKTYIYLDLNVSSTAYQITTTPATAVGIGKVLIAVATNAASAATYALSEASQIVGDNIIANTINASKLNVGQLSAITADLGAITAGTITLNTSGYIRGGQTGYDTGTGFFLGYSGGGYRFSLGDSTNKLTWNGSVLGITGTITGGLIQTSSSGIRTVLDGADSKIKFMDGSTVYAHILPYNFGLTINTKNTGGLAQMYLSENGTNIQAGLFASNAILQMSTVSGNALIQNFSDDYDIIATDDITIDAGGNLDLNGNLRINGTTGKDATIEDVTGDNFLFDEGILILVF